MKRKADRSGDRIGAVAEKYGIHPQTLRMYEREGLLRPTRSEGRTRLYDPETIERLEIILSLTRHLGVNLAGVEVILHMKERMEKMQGEVRQMIVALREEADAGRGAERSLALTRITGGARPEARGIGGREVGNVRTERGEQRRAPKGFRSLCSAAQ